MNELTKYPKRSPSAASRVIDNEAVIVMPDKGLARVLNEAGSRIWQLLDGKNSIEDIINIIASEFEVTQKEAEKDTLDFIKELEEKNMLVLNDGQAL